MRFPFGCVRMILSHKHNLCYKLAYKSTKKSIEINRAESLKPEHFNNAA